MAMEEEMTDLTKFTGKIKNISGYKTYVGDYRIYVGEIIEIKKPIDITEFVQNKSVEVIEDGIKSEKN